MKGLKGHDVGVATITEVRISDDLKHAKVYVSILGDPDTRKKHLAELERAGGQIRAELGRHLKLRYVPELRFVRDESLDYAERIDSLLHQIHNEHNDDAQKE
jgi:ribosome-binding factor A